MKIAVLAGDGIGPEIVAEAVKALRALGLPMEFEGRNTTRCRARSGPSRVCCGCARNWACSPTCGQRSSIRSSRPPRR